MFIHPLNIKVFYYNELPTNIKAKLIENKITYIIGNLEKENYSHYRKTIDMAKKSKTPLLYREFLREYNKDDIEKELHNEKNIYDIKGNKINITKKENNYFLVLTKDTILPIKLHNGDKFNVYFKDDTKELPTITKINVKAPNKRIAKEIAFSKLINHSKEYAKNSSLEHIEKID